MSNKVLITNSQKAVKVPSGLRILIRRACNAVLEYEHFDEPAEISVTFVDNAAIAELNNQYRNKPMPTDVLSFPLGENGIYDVDENNGCKMLGDIVMAPLNVLSEIATPVSMSFRHFGNMAGGLVITTLIMGALKVLSGAILGFLPVPLLQIGLPGVLSLYFDCFTACMQAFIFSMLTMAYVGDARSS